MKLPADWLVQTWVGMSGVLHGQRAAGKEGGWRSPRDPGVRATQDVRRPVFPPSVLPRACLRSARAIPFGLEANGVQNQAHNLPPSRRLPGQVPCDHRS